jgi:hypothetical protein
MMMSVEQSVEWELARETEVLGENLPQCHFCPSQNSTWPEPGLNPGRRGGKPTTNRLSYGAAYMGWIDMAQDRDQWRALVNTVMNL